MAALRSRTVYPDDIEVDFKELFNKKSKLKIAVIDDNEFPWMATLQSKGYVVDVYKDYYKSNTKSSLKKLTPYKLEKYDLIFCDIEGVGSSVYPGLEGVGVIHHIRELYPLHVVVAFTGSPARLLDSKTGKSFTSLDAIFQRDWEVDDFLFNFNQLVMIFSFPKQRWHFIRNRLVHFDINESKIIKVQRAFIQNVLLLKYLGERTSIPKNRIQEIILKSEKNVDIHGVINVTTTTVKAINIASSLFLNH